MSDNLRGKKDFMEKDTPSMPLLGWMGDNSLKKSANIGHFDNEIDMAGFESFEGVKCEELEGGEGVQERRVLVDEAS